MTLTAADCIARMNHTIGGDLNPQAATTYLQLVNDAGEYLVNCHRWKWLEGVNVKLNFRGLISVEDADLDTAGTVITPDTTSSLADYVFVEGDRIEITGGTGVTLGQFIRVASFDGTSLTMAESVATGLPTDVDFRFELPTVALPLDYRETVAVDATESLTNSMHATSHSQLLQMRTNNVQVTSYHFYFTINHARPTNGGAPVPVMEIWPEPAVDDEAGVTLVYRAGWSRLTVDTEVLTLPIWMDGLFLELCAYWARGVEEEDEGTLAQRLVEFEASPYLDAAKRQDGQSQHSYGPLRGGAVTSQSPEVGRYLRTVVTGPT